MSVVGGARSHCISTYNMSQICTTSPQIQRNEESGLKKSKIGMGNMQTTTSV